MTDLMTHETARAACPAWCVNDTTDSGPHAHVSADVVVEALGSPLVARLVQVAAGELRVAVNDHIATLEQAKTFAAALRRLTDDATLAEPGLGFITRLAGSAGVSVEEMALASGIELERLRRQQAGGQALTIRELDQLALAVARLVANAPGTAGD
jgi:hypothetical protein